MKPRYTVLLPFLGVLALGLASCALEMDLSGKPTLYVDEWVNRPFMPEIYVRPENTPLQPQRAVFLPFRVRQDVDNAGFIGVELSRVFHQTWLKDRVFDTLAFAEDRVWSGPEEALEYVRRTGADLVVGGEITYLMFGGSAGETSVSLRLSVYDAATGDLIWSMAHAGQMRAGLTGDYILLDKKSRLPAEPVQAVIQALARDMGKPVRRWNFGLDKKRNTPAGPSPLG